MHDSDNILDKLSVIYEGTIEAGQVVYLLTNLSVSYNVLVTALETSAEVDRLAVVKEHLLQKNQKQRTNQIDWVMKRHSLTASSKIKDLIIWALHKDM